VIKVLGSWFWVLGSRGPELRARTQNLEPRIQHLLLLVCILASACGPRQATLAQETSKHTIEWHTLATFTGRGNEQTQSFTSDTGVMRILWEAKPSSPASSLGTLRVTIHSAISGRPLLMALDQKGPGKGTAFVGEDPRVFFAVVDSRDLDWSFTVQERVN
jgi:hypothetical protein